MREYSDSTLALNFLMMWIPGWIWVLVYARHCTKDLISEFRGWLKAKGIR